MLVVPCSEAPLCPFVIRVLTFFRGVFASSARPVYSRDIREVDPSSGLIFSVFMDSRNTKGITWRKK